MKKQLDNSKLGKTKQIDFSLSIIKNGDEEEEESKSISNPFNQMSPKSQCEEQNDRSTTTKQKKEQESGSQKTESKNKEEIIDHKEIKLKDVKNAKQKKYRNSMNKSMDLSFFAQNSLYLFSLDNTFRMWMIQVMVNKWFDRVILVFILTNCVFLAIDDPNIDNLPYQDIADLVFLCVFSTEMVVKILALGFVVEPNTYLRNAWNVMDFIVVIMSWISKVITSSNVSALRVIRILRPLRTITSIPSMRRLVNSLLRSMPTMIDFFILFLFFIIIFGTVATQLFGGLLLNRCLDSEGTVQTDEYGNELFCNDQVSCDSGYTCVESGNPDFGVTSFDNMMLSALNIFIVITMEGWTDIMYKVRRATGTIANDFYFYSVVVIGTFFIINLMIAVQYSYLSVAFKESSSEANSSHREKRVEDIEKEINFYTSGETTEEVSFDTHGNVIDKRCCCPEYYVFQEKVKWLVEHRIFNIITMSLILVNTLFMAMQHYNMSDVLSEICNNGNSILTLLFAVEMVLKVIGLGPKYYLMDGFNVFDAVIVIIGLLEYANVGSKAVTVLRTFRLLRIFKLVRNWHNLRKLLQTILKSILSMTNLAFLMLILIFIYSLMGMQLLSGDIPKSEENQFRINFNSFFDAIIAVFVLLTAENWNAVLQAFILKDGWGASLYFISLIIFGNIMLLNLFLAILLNFISENLEDEKNQSMVENAVMQEQKSKVSIDISPNLQIDNGVVNGNSLEKINQDINNQRNKLISPEFLKWNSTKIKSKKYKRYMENSNPDASRINDNSQNLQEDKSIGDKENYSFSEVLAKQSNSFILNSLTQEELEKIKKQNQLRQIKKYKTMTTRQVKATAVIKEEDIEGDKVDSLQDEEREEDKLDFGELFDIARERELTGESPTTKQNRKANSASNKTVYRLRDKTVFCLDKNNKIRLYIKALLEHEYYEYLVLNVIGLNSILLALDQPIITDPYFQDTQQLLTNIISIFYIIEALLKITMLGFVFGEGTYLREKWNILDFTIVIFTCTSWIIEQISDSSIGFLRVLRAFRALRPLKMAAQNEGLKTVINSLLNSIPSLFNVVLITLLFLLVFSILSVQLLEGAMSYCSYAVIGTKQQCWGYYVSPDDGETLLWMEWITPFNNFNNVFYAMVTFFEVATLEGWPDILFATIDSQGEDQGPLTDNRKFMAIMYIVFIFITTFFIMNLFISVVVDKFNDEIKKNDLSQGFSEQEKDWLKVQKLMVNKRIKTVLMAPKDSKFRLWFFRAATNYYFELFIIIIIILNTGIICIDYKNMPDGLVTALDSMNIAFVVIFGIEAIMKLIALGFKQYFRERWNVFDFTIVILSILTSSDAIFPFKVNSLRIIRIARLLRMVKASKGLRNLLKALFMSLKSIGNVVTVLFLIFFTFAVAGMDLFGFVPLTTDFIYLNDQANFSTFYLAFSTLFRGATGESWNGLMHDCYQINGIIAIGYWLLFQIVSKYMFLNIFVAVIFDNFAEVDAEEKGDFNLPVKKGDIKAFMNTWVQFCPDGNHYLKTAYFISFLKALPSPLGLKDHEVTKPELYRYLVQLGVQSYLMPDGEAYVYFPEVLWNLFNQAVGPQRKELIWCNATLDIMQKLRSKYRHLPKGTSFKKLTTCKLNKNQFTVIEYIIALTIYRRYRFNKNVRQLRENLTMKLYQRKAQKVKNQVSSSIPKTSSESKIPLAQIQSSPTEESQRATMQFQNRLYQENRDSTDSLCFVGSPRIHTNFKKEEFHRMRMQQRMLRHSKIAQRSSQIRLPHFGSLAAASSIATGLPQSVVAPQNLENINEHQQSENTPTVSYREPQKQMSFVEEVQVELVSAASFHEYQDQGGAKPESSISAVRVGETPSNNGFLSSEDSDFGGETERVKAHTVRMSFKPQDKFEGKRPLQQEQFALKLERLPEEQQESNQGSPHKKSLFARKRKFQRNESNTPFINV